MAYRVQYLPITKNHFRILTARQRAIVLDIVDEQLTYEPTVITRNRFLMRPDSLGAWELRVGELRIYYDVEEDPRTSSLHCSSWSERGQLSSDWRGGDRTVIEFKGIVKRTKQLLSTLFQTSRVDPETEAMSKNQKFLSILKLARSQTAKGGLSSQEMRRWVEDELSKD